MSADVYVKPARKTVLYGAERVAVGDVAEVVAPPDLLPKIKAETLFKPRVEKKRKMYLVSITDIINAVNRVCPNATVNNVGEFDSLVECRSEAAKTSALWRGVKIALVALTLTVGSATAIMSFHSDANLPEVFRNVYYIFFREKIDNPMIIEIPYAIGVAGGIALFYNHIAGKKLTDDPTPIQVAMSVYDGEVSGAIIEHLSAVKPETAGSLGE